jgi:hypothetical protein
MGVPAARYCWTVMDSSPTTSITFAAVFTQSNCQDLWIKIV